MQKQTPEFVIHRQFDAPVSRVFKAWADVQQMAQWSGPAGSRTVVLSGEVAEGSTLFARAENNGEPYAHTVTRYLEVVPDSRLVWEQSFADENGTLKEPEFAPGWPVTLRTTVDFRALGETTEITLRWVPVDATPEQEAMFARSLASMKGGWSSSFEKLDHWLAEAIA
jgi:uncharacterized protein YndB with AHSA1/START domain